MWDMWSRQSVKYVPDICARKWLTFTLDRVIAEGIAFDHLLDWAQADGYIPNVPPCPPRARPSDYVKAFTTLGYTPAMNSMNDRISISGVRLSDPLEAKI